MLIDYKAKVSATSRIDHVGFRVIPGKSPGDEIVLRPGVQEVSAAAWTKVRENSAIGFDAKAKAYKGHLVESGAIKILEDDSLGGKADRFEIGKLTPADVRELVTRTTVPSLLRAWRREISAKDGTLWEQVLKEIDEQLLAVTTDANGDPAEQRDITLPKTAHG